MQAPGTAMAPAGSDGCLAPLGARPALRSLDYVTKPRGLGGLHRRNVLCHSSEGHNSKTKVWAGLVPSQGREGRVCSRPVALARGTPPSLCAHLSLSKFSLFVRTLVLAD